MTRSGSDASAGCQLRRAGSGGCAPEEPTRKGRLRKELAADGAEWAAAAAAAAAVLAAAAAAARSKMRGGGYGRGAVGVGGDVRDDLSESI